MLYQLSYFRVAFSDEVALTDTSASLQRHLSDSCFRSTKKPLVVLRTVPVVFLWLPSPEGGCCGRGWIRTTEALTQQIYSLPHLATLEHAQSLSISRASCRTRTNDLEITNHVLYQLS